MKKFVIIVGDGMADDPLDALGGVTPLAKAKTPNMDQLARQGQVGLVRTVPTKMAPGSDVAGLSILGYDPREGYTGRAPLEAANMGIELADDEIAFRCNLVTVDHQKMADYSAGHISTQESHQLIAALNAGLGSPTVKFHPGVGYRHILVLKDPKNRLSDVHCTPPHDIAGKPIEGHLPKREDAEFLRALMYDSVEILKRSEINQVRLDLRENPATMIWLWGQGKRPRLELFKARYGLAGGVISAVDLLNGIGRLIGLKVITVPGATGYYDTDYRGKADYAMAALKSCDFMLVHIEAPDEASHNGDLPQKIRAIEEIDKHVVGPLSQWAGERGDVRLLILPDHATPVLTRTHHARPIPFVLWGPDIAPNGQTRYDEEAGERSGLAISDGPSLMNYFLGRSAKG